MGYASSMEKKTQKQHENAQCIRTKSHDNILNLTLNIISFKN